jgi:hypothetical protein
MEVPKIKGFKTFIKSGSRFQLYWAVVWIILNTYICNYMYGSPKKKIIDLTILIGPRPRANQSLSAAIASDLFFRFTSIFV